jgi:hypothetical protein
MLGVKNERHLATMVKVSIEALNLIYKNKIPRETHDETIIRIFEEHRQLSRRIADLEDQFKERLA